jgi:hypothetical protein
MNIVLEDLIAASRVFDGNLCVERFLLFKGRGLNSGSKKTSALVAL